MTIHALSEVSAKVYTIFPAEGEPGTGTTARSLPYSVTVTLCVPAGAINS